ncbi:MAG: DNA protecting protein DprA [Candidatus Coatesbacteria bacterium RBG_13_66_14]|uniref:DNA protecting protein DprA n=1 Tax=Candidatus Coatesbacteria bacterium RBG_13_66_14 TaxID=1817816 RepID=A0A1F5FIG1_9BACT|nr:MAG: DNA protecting protein DprA [Candidatus Coatesbacteria bacterium RBG_13_66_14]
MSPGSEVAAWISLNLVPEVGPVHFRRLVERLGSAREVLAAPHGRLLQIEGIGPVRAANVLAARSDAHSKRLEQELDAIKKIPDLSIYLLADPDYPAPLKDLPDPPPVLYVRGEYRPEDRLAVSMVGTRNPSAYGRELARKLGAGLARVGVTVVSGCAAGIDLASQMGAVAAGGRSIGVLGCGVDLVYPANERASFERITASGALVSGLPLGAEPLARNFPPRNRLIAALGLGVVVVEAPLKSGALITAEYAMELNREVMSCPGNAIRDGARGSHALLKDGATLVETVEDILRAVGHAADPRLFADRVSAPEAPDLTDGEAALLGTLTAEPVHVDELTNRLGSPRAEVLQLLLSLELKGVVEPLPGMYYRRPF